MSLTTSAIPAALLAMSLACSGCSERPREGALTPVASNAAFEGTSRVTILAATTRQRSGSDPGEMFSGDRAADVSYASIGVSIPPDSARKVGAVQWPSTLPGDPRQSFVTTSASYISKQDFRTAISAAAKSTKRRMVLVFVHGFNNRFDDAVYRFAQVVHDSNAPGIPVLFTWPSRGELKLRSYTYDRESANYSRDALEDLLEQIGSNPDVAGINIVAHSMGNWVTLEALRARSIRANQKSGKIRNVMLVAPDVDVDVFRTQIRRIGNSIPRTVLFVSRDDAALKLSQEIWGGVPRLGEVDPGAEPYRGEFERARIEVVDLTTLKSPGDNAHDRAFDDIGAVMAIIRKQFGEDQVLAEPKTSRRN